MSNATPPEVPTATKKSQFFDPKANLKVLLKLVIGVLILLAGLWLLLRMTAGEKAANKATAAILQRPIEVKNAIENVPAKSFKAFPLVLPYTGTLTIDVRVLKGNELDVLVIEDSQIENLKARKNVIQFQDFEATKTKILRRSARLKSGSYYLVLTDTSLGLLSAPSSDVQINARLEP